MRVLAGDIGGTKTILQIADVYPNNYNILFEKTFASKDFEDFMPLLKVFLKDAALQADMILNSACFGVAGPVTDNFARTTNLPWILDGAHLSRELRVPDVRLINDFQAVGYGLETLREGDILPLQEGVEVLHGPRVILGAGTGLGEGIMYWDQDHYEILPSEGGHVDFAPTDLTQVKLYCFLKKKMSRVDYENIISGSGLGNIFNFLCSIEGAKVTRELEISLQEEDRASAISRYALEGKDPIAVQALNIFCQVYGAQAGNLALTCLATGGVYVAGGIAAKIIDKLNDGTFIQAFTNKGKMSALLEKMPVKVVMNARVGLMGAAMAASRLQN